VLFLEAVFVVSCLHSESYCSGYLCDWMARRAGTNGHKVHIYVLLEGINMIAVYRDFKIY
jgi:hypothetical protein